MADSPPTSALDHPSTPERRARGAPNSSTRPPTPRAGYLRDFLTPFLFGWTPILRESRFEVAEAWSAVAGRVIDAAHSSGWIAGGIEQSVSQMVGPTGLALNLLPTPDILGNVDETETWARDVERRFEQWCRDAWSCDRGGRYSIAQLAVQASRQYYYTGEAVGLLPFRERVGSTHGTKLEILPSTRLALASKNRDAVQGVIMDRDGAPVAYVFNQPRRAAGTEIVEEVTVRARDQWGRPAVIHLFDGAPTAVRGISVLVAVLKVIKQYEQFADATLVAALIQAILVASVESDSPTADIMRALQSPAEQEEGGADAELQPGAFNEYMEKRFEWYEKAQIDLGRYGKIAHMFSGEKLNMHRSEHPNTGYTDFSKGLLREIARCLGTTYEQFTGDYIGATYSSIRMGIADVWPLNLYRRAVIPARLMQTVFECWLEEDIERGNTPFPGGVDAFLDQRQSVCHAEWRGPPKPTADEAKTAQAQQIQRQEGWVPTEQLAAEYGNDHRAVIESQARTNALREQNKLPPLPSKEGGAPKDKQKGGEDGDGGARERAGNEADAKGRDARIVAAVTRGDMAEAARLAELEWD